MNFEIQALGGKLIGSRSAMKTLDRLTTLLPNAEINFETLTIPTEIESDEDDDDITLAELKEQLEDNMTLAEIQKELVKVEAMKKRLETIRLKKEKKETFEFVDEMTRQKPASPKKADFELGGVDHVPNF